MTVDTVHAIVTGVVIILIVMSMMGIFDKEG